MKVLPNTKGRIFVSHANDDKIDFVEPFVCALEKQMAGKWWFDKECVLPGRPADEQIHQALNDSKGGIVIISKAFLQEDPEAELVRVIELHVLNHKLRRIKNFFLIVVCYGTDPNKLPAKYKFLKNLTPKPYFPIKNKTNNYKGIEDFANIILGYIRTYRKKWRKKRNMKVFITTVVVAILGLFTYGILFHGQGDREKLADQKEKEKKVKDLLMPIDITKKINVVKEPQNRIPKKEKTKINSAKIVQYEIKNEANGPNSQAIGINYGTITNSNSTNKSDSSGKNRK